MHSINYSQQTPLMVFVICVISRSSGAREKPAKLMGERGRVVSAATTSSLLHQALSDFMWMLHKKTAAQSSQTTAACSMSEFDPPRRQRENDNIFPSVGAGSC